MIHYKNGKKNCNSFLYVIVSFTITISDIKNYDHPIFKNIEFSPHSLQILFITHLAY